MFVFYSHHIPVRLESSPKAQPERLQFASWLGDTTSLLIVFNNDIYHRKSPTEEFDTRITFTGHSDIIYNGIPDWLYQEDILQSPEALWSSYDGTHLMYATFNDSQVGTMNFPWFQFQTGSVLGSPGVYQRAPSFPSSRTLRYPTPGTPIPSVQLWIVDISNLTSLEYHLVQPPKALQRHNGRPGSKSVTEEFQVDWGTYMSSHCDVVYIKLDVRGARGQTDRSIYHQLGGVEVQDQSYADEGHLLEGVIEHVYNSMQNFFEECLNLDTDEKAKEREEKKEKEED
ncbi:unnamed protein product [Diabrotica balteata]|uniref:Dipeptidylpeptidase IV N-terminal domain-containing protein n=1 Tax=Diabrotica balteata TaxID=107213 RepID=A0A9N9TEY0_DIABA|nr:unnamed protein product [Diabrotica balteata]